MKYAKYVVSNNLKNPVYLIFYVTDRCNLKCEHCFYSEELNKKNEIPLENIEKLTKNIKSIFHVVFTGGEPFLRQEIDAIIGFFHKNAGMKVASIPTNGSFTDVVADKVEKILTDNPELILNITISIDGTEELHDKIRAQQGSYKRAMATLAKLGEIRKKFDRLNVGVICTLTGTNENEIFAVFDNVHNNYYIDHFQVNFLRAKPKNVNLAKPAIETYKKINEYIKKNLYEKSGRYYNIPLGDFYTAINQAYKDIIIKTVETGKYVSPCYAASTNGIIYPNGDVFACEIRSDSKIGNLYDVDFDLKKLWASERAEELRKDIIGNKCFCTFECQLTSNVVFNAKNLGNAAKHYAKIKVNRLFD